MSALNTVNSELAIHSHAATESCPWCGSSISRAKFKEIEAKIADQQRKKSAEEAARIEQKFLSEKQAIEARAKEDAEKKVSAMAAERDKATAKVKEIEAREASIRKDAAAQAEGRVKAEAEKKLTALAAERDKVAAKAKDLEAANQRDLEQQRRALEKDRDMQLLKVQAERNREREQFQKKIDALNRQAQHKTADDLGNGAEVDVYEALRDAYAGDEITRVKRGQPGADIRDQVFHKGTPCGRILIDSKNRQGWQNAYVTKLREDQTEDKADYAVLATTVFPSGKKDLYVDDDTKVIVVNRARAVEVIGILRAFMVRMHLLGLSQQERAEKEALLYKYMTSEDFRQLVAEAERLTTDMAGLDVEEKKTHDKVWEKRGKMTTRLRNVVRQIDTEVSAIAEGRRS